MDCSRPGNLRFRKLRNKYIITNEGGDWETLSLTDFGRLINGKIKKNDKIYSQLADKNFIDINKKNLAPQASRYLDHNYSTYMQGPSLFIFVLTLRCNHRCLYCQATPERPRSKGFDMSETTAKKAVDIIFRTPSQHIGIEFQGGEPTMNWPTLKFIVKYANELNKIKDKKLKTSLVSNLTLLDDKKIRFLINNGVSISCSLDGPAKVHNKNRPCLEKGTSYASVSGQIKKIQSAIKQKRKASPGKFVDELNAILTVSKFSLPYGKEIIAAYRKNGFNKIFLRQLSPFGLERNMFDQIGYTADNFIVFYRKTMDHILALNLEGNFFIERSSAYALKKILGGIDPGYFEMRSPCGAGIGQMAFNYDGAIYSCDEGRMAFRMGYENFLLGNVKDNNFNQLIDNPVTKTLCVASCLDNHVSCSDCAYKPYCGTCPVANFVEYDTIFPQIPNTDRCKINMAMFDYLFSKIQNKKYRAVFENWLEKIPSVDDSQN